ncbi:Zinc finger FYVE domain-containing protein 26 isoform 2 [Hibiscus syriacus]|uniref:Zinc finger FYVE domain-containing protein 26 isoform 2 n=1 Tax=Hibiscus syriacus TaxID=106335 RepID=A0A6A3BDA4_HIBSY|nr:Zinc finger FYVE domain-containing protein 26 isoform 2 [Hibiscus syriacus]
MDKETELLSHLVANHLHLAQIEPLRATLLALRTKDPELARAILQTIVANSGRFENIAWSPSCPSPALLTYLSTLELLQFNNPTSIWSFDPDTLRLRAEFLLLVQVLIDKILASLRRDVDLDKIEKEKVSESEGFEEERPELLDRSEDLKEGNGDLGDCVRVLDRFLELGMRRLRPDVVMDGIDDGGGEEHKAVLEKVLIEEEDLVCLRKVIIDYADLFDALCANIQRQLKGLDDVDLGMAIMVRREEKVRVDSFDEEHKGVLSLMQKSVQLAHLDAMKLSAKDGDIEGAVSHIRFLHLDHGVEEILYRKENKLSNCGWGRSLLKDLLKRVLSEMEIFGESRHSQEEKLLRIYEEALSSNCRHLIQIIKVIHDELLVEEIEMYRSLDNNQIPPPLEHFQKYLVELKPNAYLNNNHWPLTMASSSCMRDLFHYARISGLHVLECVMNTTLSAIKKENIEEANNVLVLFPRLRPLIATMGWDLLSGKTILRRNLMQLLWISKSHTFQLEEYPLYGNQSDEVSCVEHLCDQLCYNLDIASFVACVNSGQPWSSKFSLRLSGRENIVYGSEDAKLDTFVENFVLERLAVQTPLRVLFDAVPSIKFQDAIELISMQPIASTLEAWKRNDIVFEKGSLDKVKLFFLVRYRVASWFLAKYSNISIPLDCLVGELTLADQHRIPSRSVLSESKWCPPPGFLKLNVDGAVNFDWRCSGIGGVLRDADSKRDKGTLILESDSYNALKWISNPETCPDLYVHVVRVIAKVQDIELMHMRYALESTVLALGAMERSMTGDKVTHQVALCHLQDLKNHLAAIKNIPRKILMVNVIISLLHMDNINLNLMHCASIGGLFQQPVECGSEHTDLAIDEGGNKMVISFTGLLLDIVRCSLPPCITEEHASTDGLSMSWRQALEWRISMGKRFIEDWEWRLSILQRLLPLSERHWSWKESLTVLQAAPSKLLNLCMQRAKYDIGEEAVHRFSLSVEDRATLELAEWVDNAFGKVHVENAVSLAADGASTVQDLDFSLLRSQLGPLPAIFLCVDVAATSARRGAQLENEPDTHTLESNEPMVKANLSPSLASNLIPYSMNSLHVQAQVMLSEIYPGGSPKDSPPVLQAILTGEISISLAQDSHRQGQKERGFALLHQMIEDAHMGKRQFLSGKLHNLAKAIADEEMEVNFTKGEGSGMDLKVQSSLDKDGVLGLGLKAVKKTSLISMAGDNSMQSVGYDMMDAGKRLFGPLSAKPTTYLSQFILHIAAIGDIVDGTDTTHDFNFFSHVYEWPKDLLTRLVFDRGSTDAAGKVAEIMSSDFVHEVISACVPPVYPPRSGHGWACIPVIPTCPRSCSENKVLSPSAKEAKPSCYSRSSATSGIPLYPLQLDIVKHLVKISPVRAVLACVFGSSMLHSGNDSPISSSLDDDLLQTPDIDWLFYEFALDQSERWLACLAECLSKRFFLKGENVRF